MTTLLKHVSVLMSLLCVSALPAADIEDEINEVTSDYSKRVAAAKSEYEDQVRRSAGIAIARLESLAKSAVRTGDLASATKAWRHVLQLDSSHRDARAHFKAIGQLQTVLSDIEKNAQPETPDQPPDSVVVDFGSIPVNVVELKPGLAYFTDRDYKIVDIPKQLEGLVVTQLASDKHRQKQLKIDVGAGQTVFLLCDHRTTIHVDVLKLHQLLATNGFQKVGAVTATDKSLRAFLVLGKRFSKAETLVIPVNPSAMVVAKSIVDRNANK